MAATYEPIATTTLGSAVSSYTFSSIPATYTDLILVANYGSSSSSSQSEYRVNGDTTNYSNTTISGNGSSATSGRVTNDTVLYLNKAAYASTNIGTTAIINFQNYANTSTYKTMLSRYGTAANEVTAGVQLWRSTSAINSITFLFDTGNILAGSTFTLYGIKAA